MSDALAEFTPAILLALVIAALVAFLTFVAVSLLTAKFALGLDFAITVGLAPSAAAAIGTFIVAFRRIRASISQKSA
jgi:hypothetical protein